MKKSELKELMKQHIVCDIDLEYMFDFVELLLLRRAKETEIAEPYATHTIHRYKEAALEVCALYDYVDEIMSEEDEFAITYDVNCFERTLRVVFPYDLKDHEKDIYLLLDAAYYEWNHSEDIIDEVERKCVQDSCCEEHMIYRLSHK